MKKSFRILTGLLAACMLFGVHAAETTTTTTKTDPHYTDAGFFDIHVCNWEKRPLFFLALFSTRKYKDVKSVEMFDPDGKSLGQIGLVKYRLITEKGKPEKRVFINQIDVPNNARNGWYTATITLKNGTRIIAKDYVILESMRRVEKISPAPGAENIPVPKKLSWEPIPGAAYYQVFIKDMWDDGKTILTSKLLDKPFLDVPKNLLQPGGSYVWRIHARDVNENILLGDFNHGSLTPEMTFSTAD